MAGIKTYVRLFSISCGIWLAPLAQALAPLSLKPQEKLRLELTFPAQLRLGPQTRAGVLEFQCDFDVTLEPAP